MLDVVASMLRRAGLRPVFRRASYAALGGGTVAQERVVVFSGNMKIVVSQLENSGMVEVRVVSQQGLSPSLVEGLEEKGALVDGGPDQYSRVYLKLRDATPGDVAGLVLRLCGEG